MRAPKRFDESGLFGPKYDGRGPHILLIGREKENTFSELEEGKRTHSPHCKNEIAGMVESSKTSNPLTTTSYPQTSKVYVVLSPNLESSKPSSPTENLV